ncbi:MAG: MurR/RpiR family transcriptional regulator [Sphaerochaetaceae bacterium]|nr:MurR/RpiR family transcriptional regulator [Sphaerochaetaceae bacterium]MDD5076012.1 MurR/RpiR family transcriptional regulator [Sphaerochaetaceae bacterium]MDX9934295.1 MurR/RpiR family transcriptional regulator [Sphaerochaetaceae bacterium]
MIGKLKAIYSTLSSKYRQVADFIIHNPDEVLMLTINDLSEKTRVSSATISRFMKHIYGMTFPQVKVAFAKSISKDFDNNARSVLSYDNSMFQIEKSLAENLKNLFEETIQLNPIKKIIEIAKMIAQAENIYLFGIGASALAVQDFALKLIKLGKRALFNMDANLAILNSSLCTEKDVVIAISYSGLTKEVLIPSKKAISKHCPVICITSDSRNKLSNIATCALCIPSTESMIIRMTAIYSRYGQFFLIDLLYMAIMKEITDNPDKIMEKYKDLLLELK